MQPCNLGGFLWDCLGNFIVKKAQQVSIEINLLVLEGNEAAKSGVFSNALKFATKNLNYLDSD